MSSDGWALSSWSKTICKVPYNVLFECLESLALLPHHDAERGARHVSRAWQSPWPGVYSEAQLQAAGMEGPAVCPARHCSACNPSVSSRGCPSSATPVALRAEIRPPVSQPLKDINPSHTPRTQRFRGNISGHTVPGRSADFELEVPPGDRGRFSYV